MIVPAHMIVPAPESRVENRIVHLRDEVYGVYSSWKRGPYGTPLMFVGTLDECVASDAANHRKGLYDPDDET